MEDFYPAGTMSLPLEMTTDKLGIITYKYLLVVSETASGTKFHSPFLFKFVGSQFSFSKISQPVRESLLIATRRDDLIPGSQCIEHSSRLLQSRGYLPQA